jgi:hypothetical protein
LQEILVDAFDTAIKKAALEAFEGRYSEVELEGQINRERLLTAALNLILSETD